MGPAKRADGGCACPSRTHGVETQCEWVSDDAGAEGVGASDASNSGAADGGEPVGDGHVEDGSGIADQTDSGKDASYGCALKTWYPDCDGDGYPAADHEGIHACDAPASIPQCFVWLTDTPTPGDNADCDDTNQSYHPGADFGYAGDGSGDRNCDGKVNATIELLAFLAKTPKPASSGWCDDDPTPGTCDCFDPHEHYPGFVALSGRDPVDAQQKVVVGVESSFENPASRCARTPNDVVAALFLVSGTKSCPPAFDEYGNPDEYFIRLKCK